MSEGGEKLLAKNPKAFHDYFLSEIVEAGLALKGTEIKSLRAQSPNLKDSFIDLVSKGGETIEAWLLNAHIAPYSHGNIWNHEPLRPRKLLLHKHQLDRLWGATSREGYTVVPTRMYLKKGRAKIEIALGKGKVQRDKRDTLRKREADRDMERAMRRKDR